MPITINSEPQLPAEIASQIGSAWLPANYTAAKRALTECERIDEAAESPTEWSRSRLTRDRLTTKTSKTTLAGFERER